MQLIRMATIEGKTSQRGVLAKELISHQHVKVMNLVLKAGEFIPEHAVNVDVFFYVVSGSGSIKIGAEKTAVQAGDIVPCPPDTVMAVFADRGETLSILNVKTPRP